MIELLSEHCSTTGTTHSSPTSHTRISQHNHINSMDSSYFLNCASRHIISICIIHIFHVWRSDLCQRISAHHGHNCLICLIFFILMSSFIAIKFELWYCQQLCFRCLVYSIPRKSLVLNSSYHLFFYQGHSWILLWITPLLYFFKPYFIIQSNLVDEPTAYIHVLFPDLELSD